MKFLDLLWPHVGSVADDATMASDLVVIASAAWDKQQDIVLEEARRLRDFETDRKNTAETKSQIYLAALLALIPILVSLADHESAKGLLEFNTWYQSLGFCCYVLAIAYGIGAFVSSFRALTVRAYHRVDIIEISKSSISKNPAASLGKDILESVRKDRPSVNLKISFVVVSHRLILRMAFLLLLALSLITLVPLIERAVAAISASQGELKGD